MASFIRTFIETAANTNYRHSLYHSTLYEKYILEHDLDVQCGALPPYFPLTMFETIKEARQFSSTNIEKMTTSQWYWFLVRKEVTMVRDDNNQQKLILSRVELISPETNWERTWRKGQFSYIGSSGCSFMWKVLQNILPCENRISRILQNISSACTFFQFQLKQVLFTVSLNAQSSSSIGESSFLCNGISNEPETSL